MGNCNATDVATRTLHNPKILQLREPILASILMFAAPSAEQDLETRRRWASALIFLFNVPRLRSKHSRSDLSTAQNNHTFIESIAQAWCYLILGVEACNIRRHNLLMKEILQPSELETHRKAKPKHVRSKAEYRRIVTQLFTAYNPAKVLA